MFFLTLLVVYVLGGITFFPILIISLIFYFPFTGVEPASNASLERPEDDTDDGPFKTGDQNLTRRLANSVDVAAGYFLVTREFVPNGINGKPPERISPAGMIARPAAESQSVYQSFISIFDRKGSTNTGNTNGSTPVRRKMASNEFFAVLRHGHIMLYDDEDQTEVRHVISLILYTVSIWGGGVEIPEGELYVRRNAICLSRRNVSRENAVHEKNVPDLPFYMFSEDCSNKEDFYLALVKHQEKMAEDPTVPPRPLKYRSKDIMDLVKRLHSSEEHLQMNWVNGLLGRVFLSIYRMPEIEEFFRVKIIKKISRVNKPSFLTEIKLQRLTVGDSMPFITNPRIKEMTAEGDFCLEADVTYSGGFRLEVATKMRISLGSRFKAREFPIVLAVVLKRLEGHVLIRIKPPPSNRLWIAFDKMPKMNLSIEPIVGSQKIQWGAALRVIENRIREVVAETIVLPYFDDTPFTNTINQRFRGGIWHPANSKVPTPSAPTEVPPIAEPIPTMVNGVANNLKSGLEIPDESVGESDPPPTPESLPADSQKTASTGVLPDGDGPSSASEKSGRTARTPRTHTINPISPPAPSIGTDTINATATRVQETPDTSDATAAIMAIRSRSHNGVQSAGPALSDPPSQSQTSDSAGLLSKDEASEERFSTSIGNMSGGSAQGFGSSQFVPSGSRDRPGTNKSNNAENTTMAAIGTATALVKKWYTNRNSKNMSEEQQQQDEPIQSSPGPRGSGSRSASAPTTIRKLPPAEIPPPPPAKTAMSKTVPVSVPKQRKTLPPPLIPRRKFRHNAASPILPPRRLPKQLDGDGCAELLVIAAPISSSDPSTPREEKDRDEAFEFPLLSPEEEEEVRSEEYDDDLGMSSSNSKRSPRVGSGSWERKYLRERALEETELWHPAEEAEMRTRVPWEPDEV